MRIKMKFVLIAMLMALPVLTVSYIMALNVRVASIQSFNGNVKVQRMHDTEWIEAEQGMQLYEGDVVKTGGRSKVVIELDDGSITQLASLATMKMERLKKNLRGKDTNLDVEIGKTWMKVKKLNKKTDSFNVSTPTAVAGVRGTYFSTEVEETTDSTFDVFDGEISVAQRQNRNQAVIVKSNHRSKVKQGASTPTAPGQIPSDELQNALANGIGGAGGSQSSYDMDITIEPPVITAGGTAQVDVQFMENGQPYNGSVTFILTLGGSATFVENGSQTIEVISNERGAASVQITDNVKEEISINADVQFTVEE